MPKYMSIIRIRTHKNPYSPTRISWNVTYTYTDTSHWLWCLNVKSMTGSTWPQTRWGNRDLRLHWRVSWRDPKQPVKQVKSGMNGNGYFQSFPMQRFGENHPIGTSIYKWMAFLGLFQPNLCFHFDPKNPWFHWTPRLSEASSTKLAYCCAHFGKGCKWIAVYIFQNHPNGEVGWVIVGFHHFFWSAVKSHGWDAEMFLFVFISNNL